MPDMYKEHDILVFLSIREEGLPLVKVEAMLAAVRFSRREAVRQSKSSNSPTYSLFPKPILWH